MILLTYSKHGRRRASDLRRSLEGAFVPTSVADDPAHWKKRAEEARALADLMSDDVSKQMMLQIARDYDHLAERAEKRAKGSPQSN